VITPVDALTVHMLAVDVVENVFAPSLFSVRDGETVSFRTNTESVKESEIYGVARSIKSVAVSYVMP